MILRGGGLPGTGASIYLVLKWLFLLMGKIRRYYLVKLCTESEENGFSRKKWGVGKKYEVALYWGALSGCYPFVRSPDQAPNIDPGQ